MKLEQFGKVSSKRHNVLQEMEPSSVDYDTSVFLSEDIREGSFGLFTQMGKKLLPAIWLVVRSIKVWLLLLKYF